MEAYFLFSNFNQTLLKMIYAKVHYCTENVLVSGIYIIQIERFWFDIILWSNTTVSVEDTQL